MIFVIEVAEEFATEEEMMAYLLADAYKAYRGKKIFRSKSYFCMDSNGKNISVVISFFNGSLERVEVEATQRMLPNWYYPYMLEGSGKKYFFRDKTELFAFMATRRCQTFTLTTTTERLLNKAKKLEKYTITYTQDNLIIVDGQKYKI